MHTSTRTVALALALVLSAGALALPLDTASPTDGALVRPTPDAPWPMWGHDPERTRNAGASPVPVEPSSFRVIGNLTGGNEGPAEAYSRVAVADLDLDGSVELVTVTSRDIQPIGRVIAYDAAGEPQWMYVAHRGGPTAPLIADFDGDEQQEVFVSTGDRHILLDHDGTVLWRQITEQAIFPTVSYPLAIDLTGDGAPDIVQGTLAPDPQWPEDVVARENPTPYVYGFDGPTGEMLFEHEMPCGQWVTHLVGTVLDGVPTVLVGCRYHDVYSFGAPGAVLQALQLEEDRRSLLDHILIRLGADRDWGVEVAWETDIGHGHESIFGLVKADVIPPEGPELVTTSLDLETDDLLRVTVLSEQGTRLTEDVSPGPVWGAQHPAVGDLDGDGYAEIIINRGGLLQVLDLGREGHQELYRLDPTTVPVLTAGAGGRGASVTDLDGDDVPEIVTGWYDGDVDRSSFLIHDRTGKVLWSHHVVDDPPDVLVQPARGPVIADIDGNGTHEFLYAAYDRVFMFGGTPT